MRELLGDLGFRHTKEEVLGPAARVRVWWGKVCLEGPPCPSFYRWEGTAKGEGVLPQVGFLGRRWREEDFLPK